MTNLEEPMDIDEGWKQIKAKAIDVLLEQLQQGFDEKARPFDVRYFLQMCYFLLLAGGWTIRSPPMFFPATTPNPCRCFFPATTPNPCFFHPGILCCLPISQPTNEIFLRQARHLHQNHSLNHAPSPPSAYHTHFVSPLALHCVPVAPATHAFAGKQGAPFIRRCFFPVTTPNPCFFQPATHTFLSQPML